VDNTRILLWDEIDSVADAAPAADCGFSPFLGLGKPALLSPLAGIPRKRPPGRRPTHTLPLGRHPRGHPGRC
jgi:hypothetical protein